MFRDVRTWVARVLAPIAFFAAATALVFLVRTSFDQADDNGSRQPAAAASSSTTTEELATVATLDTLEAPTEPATEPGEARFYRVKSGDTLASIAERFDTTVDDLLALNPEIDPLQLAPRQRVRIG